MEEEGGHQGEGCVMGRGGGRRGWRRGGHSGRVCNGGVMEEGRTVEFEECEVAVIEEGTT